MKTVRILFTIVLVVVLYAMYQGVDVVAYIQDLVPRPTPSPTPTPNPEPSPEPSPSPQPGPSPWPGQSLELQSQMNSLRDEVASIKADHDDLMENMESGVIRQLPELIRRTGLLMNYAFSFQKELQSFADGISKIDVKRFNIQDEDVKGLNVHDDDAKGFNVHNDREPPSWQRGNVLMVFYKEGDTRTIQNMMALYKACVHIYRVPLTTEHWPFYEQLKVTHTPTYLQLENGHEVSRSHSVPSSMSRLLQPSTPMSSQLQPRTFTAPQSRSGMTCTPHGCF